MSVFVDTNVLVHARDRTDETKHHRALEWLAALWEERGGRPSWQVLHEYYVTTTRKLDPPRDPFGAREDVTPLATWQPIDVDLAIIDAAWAASVSLPSPPPGSARQHDAKRVEDVGLR